MTKDSRGQDSRVILLGKALTLSKGHFRSVNPGSGEMPLISLGYFDSLQIVPLTKDDWLQELCRKSIEWSGSDSLETHYHPIYITAPSCERAEDRFWSIETQFTFVTLLHYAADLTLPKGKPFASVAGRVGELTSPPGQWQKDAVSRDVYAACYRSLHLSDMVVIWKSDSLVNMLEQLHQLYRDPRIGDLRTVCSFHFFRNGEILRFAEEEIPYAMVSFCVRDSAAADEFTQLLRDKGCAWWPERGGYFTTGTRDLEVVLRNVTVEQFMRCVALWFQDSEVNAWYQKAFYESSTHLGLWDRQGHTEQRLLLGEKSPLTKACEKLFTEFQVLRKQIREREGTVELSWTRAISSQLNALVDMSRICVLDGFCYLILDGVRTFLQLVRPHLERERQIPNRLLSRIQRFVRGWGTLLDQAVRVDGQFIPSPGFSPVLYDIPVELLEFYNAFAFRCTVLLQSPEAAPRHRYALFLLPKLCRRTKVQDVFRDPPPSDRLLYVDIPLDILYAPMQVLPQLCHELSHYCGEELRQREFRAAAVLTACAHMIAWHFRLGDLNAVQLILQDLERFVPKNRRAYKEHLQAELQEYLVQLFQHYEWVRPWQEAYLFGQYGEIQGESGARWSRENTFHIRNIFFGRSKITDDIDQDLRDIFYLFEEGYADVSMMFLLGLSWEEYLSLYRQELNWLEEPGEDGELLSEGERRGAYARFVQRAALVLSATRCPIPGDPAKLPPRLREFSQCIIDLGKELETESSLQSFYKAYPKMDKNCFPVDLLLDIRDYLEQCWQEMRSTFAGEEELRQLRHVFGEVAREHHIGCAGYYETLERYERFLQQ